MARRFNRGVFTVFDYDVYAVSSAASLAKSGAWMQAARIAGRLGLSNLCWIVLRDELTAEDDADRFVSMGWNVIGALATDDVQSIDTALYAFKTLRMTSGRPTVVMVHGPGAAGALTSSDARALRERGRAERILWWQNLEAYRAQYPSLAAKLGTVPRSLEVSVS
jgi:transketolase